MKPSTVKRSQYPAGTLIAYGPDATHATKLVASIVKGARSQEEDILHRWLINEGEIRNNPTIAAEIADFFKRHGVKDTVTYDRIIGCPHEEGIDYPMGRTCPHCPFWANIDRFTHEPIKPPVPSRTTEQILAELSSVRESQPREALESAEAYRAALVEPLLQAIERGIADPSGLPEGERMLSSYATYLLAKWREPRALPYFIRWLSLPGEGAFDLGGDTVTQDGDRLLASVFDGDFEPIKSLILNREANEYCRGQAVQALSLLAIWSEVPRTTVEDYLLWLACEGLEREFNHVWNNLASACLDIEALRVFPELRRAYDEGLIENGFISLKNLAEVEAGPRGKRIEQQRELHPPIADVAEETSWWQCFEEAPGADAIRVAEQAREMAISSPFGSATPYIAPPKVGRNDPCSCGSGKKFKKCCGG